MLSRRISRRSSPSILVTVGSVLAFVVLALALLFYRNLTQPASPLPVQRTSSTGTLTADWFSVYFSDPSGPAAQTLRGGPDAALAAAIEAASQSVDMAVYDLDLWSVRDALLHARQRGVKVRLVTESDNIGNEEVQELKDAGIPVLGDRREGLMHDKFVVIDGREVWSGSMNYTVNDAYKNNNNLIRIRSTRLADDYSTEFEEMFTDDQFGPGSPANTPYPDLTVSGTRLEVYFSPDDGVAEHIVALIQGAKQSISFLAYSFTSDDIASAMLEKAREGVTVSGVVEASQVSADLGDEFDNLHRAGVDVRLDGNPHNMHHKVIIIDGQIVVTGSYNFSASAEEKNDENALVIYNPDIASKFMAEYRRVFGEAQR